MPIEKTPIERATVAAEALHAEGLPVTARAVRTRAGVMTTVAAEAAKAWRETNAAIDQIPDIPATVATRLEAIWAEAFNAARAQLDAERDGWIARIERVEEENQELAAEYDRCEEQIEQLQAANQEHEDSRREAAQLIDELDNKTVEAQLAASAAAARADAAEKALADVLAALPQPQADGANTAKQVGPKRASTKPVNG